jgi:lambda family phage tail tape measure protein
MSNIARLGAILSLDTKEFVKGIDAAQLKSKQFKQNLKETQQVLDGVKTAANATALAMLAFSVAAVKTAEEIVDLAESNETTIGKVLELKKALIATGGDAGKLSQLFSSFTNAVDGAAQGSDKLRDAFKSVGVSTKDLGLLSSDELRQKTFRGLAKIEDSVTRNALGMQLLGKAAKGVDFLKLGEEADNAAGKYDKQAAAIKSAADAAGKLELFFSDMKIAALAAMKPVSDLINLLPSENRIEAMTKGFQVLGVTLAIAFGVKAVRGVVQLGNAIRMIAITNPWLLALTAAATVGAYVFSDQLNPMPDDEEYPKTQGGGGGGAGRSMEQSARDKTIEKYKLEIAEVKKLYDAKFYAAHWEYSNSQKMLELDGKRFAMRAEDYNREKLNIDIAKERMAIIERKAQAEAEALKQLELAAAEEQKYAKQLYDEKIIGINTLYSAEMQYQNNLEAIRRSNFEAEVARQKSWSAGWAEAMKEYTEASERASDRGRAAFQSVMSNMEGALRKFVDTGKIAFGELAGSIIKDLIYMELRAQASSLFSMMFSSFKSSFMPSGGSAGSIFGDLFGGIGKKASGGRIDSPTIVGENGAELFVPQTSGTVIPNGSWQQMAAAGGGNNGITVNGNYIANMSAIDTQSATQFLAANKNAIWASYQSANRSVPISR